MKKVSEKNNSKFSLSVKPGLVSISEEFVQFQKVVVESTNLAILLRDGLHSISKIIAISFEYVHF